MASRDRRGYNVNMAPTIRRPRVSVCSSAQVHNNQAFIDELHLKFTEIVGDVRYFELPYNDIDHFLFRNTGIDVMILCHSIQNRRFAITDVMDALYDKFLYNAVRAIGKPKICILVHDFKAEDLNTVKKYRTRIEAFQSQQPTTFKCANLVMMGGKLDERVEIGDHQWEELRAFLIDAGQSPESIPSYQECAFNCIDTVNVTCQSVQKSYKKQLLLVLVILAGGLIIVLLVVLTK
ncbi:uncharacterized protein LOC105445735 [Strongylocentrotus purpuratus]|uniref:Uncharacterized protein n=1 Tax=Strongylocentrotus purpuratus TaxID=7668 RepID=A0A7M7HM07_STRPU|nr:uncharacterized protein LOC105445735 [Strongylocentrotus purpuratus]|eukprot:XP_011679951.1 PREDICTED: uncharacterized protein LOC105445735 [Strongylocentrotus purpuratus]